MCPKILLAAIVAGKCTRGRTHRIIRDAMADNANSVIPNVVKCGRVEKWMSHAKDVSN